MRLLIFLILIPFNAVARDFLLEAIYGTKQDCETEKIEEVDYYDDSEAEVYHWVLGTPDNIPETEVIYDESTYQQ